MKRYCQTLSIRDDAQLIEEYKYVHAHVWPEIIQGQHEVGILSMQIYGLGNHFFMIVETVDDFDWERDMDRLAEMPRQAEWEAFVSRVQGCDPKAKSIEKWQLMDKIFDSEK